jgi:hypothetical protein
VRVSFHFSSLVHFWWQTDIFKTIRLKSLVRILRDFSYIIYGMVVWLWTIPRLARSCAL